MTDIYNPFLYLDDTSKIHRTVRSVADDPAHVYSELVQEAEEEEEQKAVEVIRNEVSNGTYVPEAYLQNYTSNAIQEYETAQQVGADKEGRFLRIGKQALMGVPDALVGIVQDAHDMGNAIGGVVDTINSWFGDKYIIDFNPEDGKDGLINLDLRFLEEDKPQTVAEEFARGTMRFLTSWLPTAKLLKAGMVAKSAGSGIGAALSTPVSTKALDLIAGGAAGILADMAMAEGSDGGPFLTEWLASMPDNAQNILKQYLAAGEDNELLRRVQHAFEGLLVGMGTSAAIKPFAKFLTKAVSIVKKSKRVPKEAFIKLANDGEEALKEGKKLFVDNVKTPEKTSGVEALKNYDSVKGTVIADKWLSGEVTDTPLDEILRGVNMKYITDDQELANLFGTVAETLKTPEKVTHAETIELAKSTGMNLRKLRNLKENVTSLHKDILAARVLMKSGFDDMLALGEKLINGEPTTQEVIEFCHMATVNRSILEMVGDIGSGMGRAFNALKISASAYKKGLLYGEAGEDVIRFMGGRTQAIKLAKELKKAAKMPKPLKKMGKIIDKPVWKKWEDAAREVYSMSLLSAPYTHTANTLSTAAFHVMRNMEGLAVAGADAFRRGGANRSIEWHTFAADLAGQWEGIKDALSLSIRQTDGWVNAKQAIKKGKIKQAIQHLSDGLNAMPEREGGFWRALIQGKSNLDPTTKMEATQYAFSAKTLGVESSVSGHFIDYVGGVLRLFSSKPMMAVDEIFKAANYRGALYAKAVREGLDKGMELSKLKKVLVDSGNYTEKELASMTEKQIHKHYYKTVAEDAYQNITAQEHRDLMQVAKRSVFQGELEGKLGEALEATKDIPFMWTVVPFVRTPSNIVSEMVDRTPIIQFVKPSIRAAYQRGGKDRAEVFAKMCTGFSLYGVGLSLAATGAITGAPPKDPTARKMWLDAGNVPYALMVGDKAVTYDRLDPVGMFFGMSATAYQIVMNTHNETDKWNTAGVIAGAMTNVLFSKTYLKGLLDIIEILRDPEDNTADALAQILSGFIPNVINAANREIGDEFARDTKVYQGAFEYLNKTAARLPWVSDSVPVRRDYFSQPVMNEQDGFYGLLDPFTRKFKIDKTKQELWRLGVGPLAVKRSIGDVYDLTAKEMDELHNIKGNLRIRGKTFREAVESYMQKPNYATISEGYDGLPGQKQQEIRLIDQEFREKSWNIFRKKHPHIQQKEAEWKLKQMFSRQKNNPFK